MTRWLDPARHSWMRASETRAVFDALTNNGGAARFVGGAVRNAVLGVPVVDIDIAVPVPPEQTIKLLEAAGIKAIPTGLDHGTVTAVLSGRKLAVEAVETPFRSRCLRIPELTETRGCRCWCP